MKVAGLILDTFHQNKEDIQHFSGSIKETFEKLGVVFLNETIEKTEDFIQKMHAVSRAYDYVVVSYNDSPFYCEKENKRLLDNILKYRADYGFSDNHPKGVVFEILKTEALPVLHNMKNNYALSVERDIFQKIIEKDVNMFDLENLYAKTSLRTHRLSFFQDDEQEKEITLKILNALHEKKFTFNRSFHFEDLAKFILEHRDLLKTKPKYFEIEIVRYAKENSILSPYKKKDALSPMTFSNFKIIVSKIKSLTASPIIAINGVEEPSENKDLITMLKYLVDQKISCILETSLEGFSDEDIEILISLDDRLFTLILLIDATDEETYQKIRKNSISLESILNRAGTLLLRKKQTYVQATKMDLNFEQLNNFYTYFKKYTEKIIIQKYNPYLGFLPERRFNVMRPLEPIDCWHLKRDFYIHPNGDVVLCKQDVHAKNKLGNLINDEIQDVFERSLEKYSEYLEGKLPFCKKCDENYTFNF